MIALIRLNPREIVKVFASVPKYLVHPDNPRGRLVQPVVAGWKGGGELSYDAGGEATEGAARFEIVEVVRAVVPAGQRAKGRPSYGFGRNGDVAETVVLEAIPAPVEDYDIEAEMDKIKTRLTALEAA